VTSRPERLFRAYVFDLDGTVYLGDALVPGAARTLETLREAGARTLFLTNNPTSLPEEYAAKLTRLGIPTRREDVVSSIDALLAYLRRLAPGARLLPITEPVLAGVLADAGFELVDRAAAETAEVVVVAWDRTFDYAKLTAAYRAVRCGARIVATNPDPYCPTPDGGLPDCAAMVAAIEASTGARAEAIVGKPSAHMAATVLERLGVPAEETVLVGDRVTTDVRMAREAGMHAALVLTGATTRDDLEGVETTPDFVLDDVTQLIPPAGTEG
jgi:HAD superfamily hydrolase (TIGR01450 family)